MMKLRRFALPFWAVLIAVVLWVQVHGQGVGSVRMDIALQVRNLPQDMIIVNDLPEQVSITVQGLQAQLNTLSANGLFVSVDASALNLPGVIEQALDVEGIDLPIGLKIEKIQPDSVQLQVDHIVKRRLQVTPIFDLPQGWEVSQVTVEPAVVELSGPEVWLSTLSEIETVGLRLDQNIGAFDVSTALIALTGKSIHLSEKDVEVRVRGTLTWKPLQENVELDNNESEEGL
ncbi:MAG: hypothetical protein R8M45_09105 [Ghiorsea sp.]